jgi:Tfp pilus assembly protein FimT
MQKIHTPVAQYVRGISLVELLIVVAIGGGLVVLSMLPFNAIQDRQALRNAEDAIGAFITEARTRTLSSYNDDRYGLHFSSAPTTQSSQVILFKGATYVAGAGTNVVLQLSDNAKITNVSLQGGGVDMVFNRLTGGTDQYGTITLEVTPAKTVYTRLITVNKAGAISVN